MTAATAQVECGALAALLQIAQGKYMCFGQVGYVNVVPDGCTVRRWVVRSVNLHRIPLPERRLDDTRDQMGFGIMFLPDLPVGISPCRIEVAQRGPFEPISL